MVEEEFLYSKKPALEKLQRNGWSYKDGRKFNPDLRKIVIERFMKLIKVKFK